MAQNSSDAPPAHTGDATPAPVANQSEWIHSIDGQSFGQMLYNPTLIGVTITGSISLSAPPPIGNITPNTGAFTNLTVSSNATFSAATYFGGPVTFAIAPEFGVPFWTNVKAAPFNAVGNGTADDTAAIQAAATSIAATGGVLLLPPAVYGVTGPILLKSNTTVIGYGATLLALPAFSGGNLIQNTNLGTALNDHDLEVNGLTFDYGISGAGGGAHAIHFQFVTNPRVLDCTFQLRGAGDATAFPGCYNSSVENCASYGHSNCAYDHWWNPQQCRVVNCYAETALVVPFVLFNPEPTSGSSAGMAATGFEMIGCEFKCTSGSSAGFVQIEPLGAGTTVSDAGVQGNIFTNVRLLARGAANNIDVSHNTFDTVLGGAECITAYNSFSGAPTNLTIIGNKCLNATTEFANGGVIRIETDSAIIFGNTVTGSGYTAASISTSTNAPFVFGNSVSAAMNAPNSHIFTSNLSLPFGLSFGSQVASGPTDFSKHIALYAALAGFNLTAGGLLNYVTTGDGAHIFYQGSTEIGYLNAGGMNLVSGLGYAINGTNVLSGFVGGYGTPTGGVRYNSFVANGSTTLLQCAQAIAQLIIDLKSIGPLQA